MLSQYNEIDRFFPNRNYQSFQLYNHNQTQSTYDHYIKNNLCISSRILTYQNKENIQYNACRGYENNKNMDKSRRKQGNYYDPWANLYRDNKKLSLCQQAEKILDVPCTRDDFYLNTLDWSQLGPLGIGLDNQAYIYTPSTIVQLCKVLDGTYISSLKFYQNTVTLGFSDGKVKIFDLQTNCLIRQIFQHQKRVSALSFSQRNILYTGSKDRNILVNDIRIRQPTINRLAVHKGEICTLKCQSQLNNYMASGSNDNHVVIWDVRKHQFIKKYKQHKGAVKAISWCPWKSGVIASAGGAGDRTIRLWNINQNQDLAIKKTDSQISSLLWNQQSGLLISSHGLPNNQINFWKPEVVSNKALSLQKVKTLKGHNGRILNLALSPSNSMICSLSADQTLRFWRFLQSQQDPWKTKKAQKICRWSFKLK